jgi:hypothetical protein
VIIDEKEIKVKIVRYFSGGINGISKVTYTFQEVMIALGARASARAFVCVRACVPLGVHYLSSVASNVARGSVVD